MKLVKENFIQVCDQVGIQVYYRVWLQINENIINEIN